MSLALTLWLILTITGTLAFYIKVWFEVGPLDAFSLMFFSACLGYFVGTAP